MVVLVFGRLIYASGLCYLIYFFSSQELLAVGSFLSIPIILIILFTIPIFMIILDLYRRVKNNVVNPSSDG